jgi:hypothetical protein
MKRLVFSIAILALGAVAATPARADFAVIRFSEGYCQVWWDRSAPPWSANWTIIATKRDWWSAVVAMDWAITIGDCNLP